jgi:hypothetical protein
MRLADRPLTLDDITEAPPMRPVHGGSHVLTEQVSVATRDGIAIYVPVGTCLWIRPDGGYGTPGGGVIRYR